MDIDLGELRKSVLRSLMSLRVREHSIPKAVSKRKEPLSESKAKRLPKLVLKPRLPKEATNPTSPIIN